MQTSTDRGARTLFPGRREVAERAFLLVNRGERNLSASLVFSLRLCGERLLYKVEEKAIYSKPTPFTMRVLLHNSLRDFPMALLPRKTRRRLDKYCSICLDWESQSVKNDLKSMVAGLLRVQTSANRVNARKIYRFIGIAINSLPVDSRSVKSTGCRFWV